MMNARFLVIVGCLFGAGWCMAKSAAQLFFPPSVIPATAAIVYVGPLDAISAGAKATVISCYSFRACSLSAANANAKALNIQKAGPSNSDITVLTTGKLDTSTFLTFCGNYGLCALAKTYDQAASANTLTPAGGLSTFAPPGTCGVPTPCVFVNGDSGFGINAAITASFTDPLTMSYVAQYKCSSCGSYGEAISMRSATAFSCDNGHNNAANQAFLEGTSIFARAASDNQWHAVQGAVTTGTNLSVINVDGVETAGTTGHCNSTPTTMIGVTTNPPSGGSPWGGYFVEAIIFSSALSSSDRTALCQNQQSDSYGFGKANFPANC